MSTEENKALVRRFIHAQWEKDLAALVEMMAPDFIDHSVLPGQGTTREDYLQDVAEDQAASSDAQLSIEDQIAEDDKVMSRLAIRGSHDQEMLTGMPPTGLKLEFTGILINRVVDGKITEEWSEGTYMYELTQKRLEHELRERERFEHELRVAQRIQQALLPKELPPLDDWDIVPYYQPAREVGGDFYDFLPLPDRSVGVIIGDVSRERCRGGPGDGQHAERPSCRRPEELNAGRVVGTGQQGPLGLHTAQHVRDLLLRHPRSRKWSAHLRERRAQSPAPTARGQGHRPSGDRDAPWPHAWHVL